MSRHRDMVWRWSWAMGWSCVGRRVCAIIPAVSGRFVTAYGQVRSYSSTCGTCSGKSESGTGTGVLISP